MKKVLIVLMMICHVLLFSEEGLKSFDVKIFKVGKGDGEINWDEGFASHSGITTAAIGCDEDTIYIGDSYNNRGIVLDYNYNIKKYLNGPEDNAIWNSFWLTVFDEIYLIMSGDGEIIFNLDSNKLEERGDSIFFFLKVADLPFSWNALRGMRDARVLNYLKVGPVQEYKAGWRIFNSVGRYEEDIQKFLEANDIIIYNDRLLTSELKVLRSFFELNKRYDKRYDKRLEDHLPFNYGNVDFLGYDKKDRSYWVTRDMEPEKQFLLVCSNYGELLFARQNLTEKSLLQSVAVLPDGSLLRLNNMPENDQFVLSKFPNTWDTSFEISSSTFASQITSSSFVDYKSQYVGSCAFDGNPQTAWLEGIPGAGVGEKLVIEFNRPVTVDKIEFMPGYFDPQWFTANNRVKRLRIILDTDVYYTDFEDVMKAQYVKFKEPKSFRKAEFTIVSVYPGKDNDTAISEIAFYQEGKKLELGETGK